MVKVVSKSERDGTDRVDATERNFKSAWESSQS